MIKRHPNKEIIALAIMGGAIGVSQLYNQAAPTLQGLRSRPPSDITGRQQLLDADLLVGSVVIAIGLFVSYEASSPVPLLTLILVFTINSYWHHLILNSPNGHTEEVVHVG